MDAISLLRTTTPRLSAAAAPPPAQAAAGPAERVTLGSEATDVTVDLRAAARALDSVHAQEPEILHIWKLDVDHYDTRAFPAPGGRLYEAGLSGKFRALTSEGQVAWQRQAGDNDLSVNPVFSPDGTLFTSRVVALEAWNPDGTRRWSNPLSDGLQLAAAAGPEGHVYVQDHAKLYALEGASGKVLWTKPVEQAWVDRPATVGPDGTVYAVAKNNVVHAYSADGREKWHFDGLRKDGGLLCDVTTNLAVGPKGQVYFGDRFGKLHCLGPDGKQRWLGTLDGELTNYESPTVDGQGRVYVGAKRDDSHVVCFDDEGNELWRRNVGSILHLTGDPRGGVVVGVKGGPLDFLDSEGKRMWRFREGNTFTEPTFGPDGTLYTGAGKTLYAVKPGPTLKEQGATAAHEAVDAPPEASPVVDQYDGWVLVGDVSLPVRGDDALA